MATKQVSSFDPRVDEAPIPEGWASAPIGSLCRLVNGRAFKPSEWTTTGLPIIRIQNLNNPDAKFNHYSGPLDRRHAVKHGDLLFAWSGTPGTSFGAHIWKGGPAVLNQHIFRVDFPEELLDKEYLRLAINQRLDDLIDAAHGGAGLAHVTKGVVEGTALLIAPLPEQRRVVAAVRATLLRLTSCQERLARVRASIAHLHRLLLEAGRSGRLTSNGRTHDDVDREEQALPQGWRLTTLGKLLREPLRNGHSARISENGTGVRTLTLSAVTYGDFSERNTKVTVANPDKVHDLWLESGDILVERANTPELVGTARLYRGASRFAIFPDLLIRVRVGPDVLAEYVELVLQSDFGRRHFTERAQGTAGSMPKIDQGVVLTFPLALPSLLEQAEIVRRVSALAGLLHDVEKRVNRSVARAFVLEKAILRRAFCGGLVPTEAELAASEGRSYETGAQLLERVKLQAGPSLSGTADAGRKRAPMTRRRPQASQPVTGNSDLGTR